MPFSNLFLPSVLVAVLLDEAVLILQVDVKVVEFEAQLARPFLCYHLCSRAFGLDQKAVHGAFFIFWLLYFLGRGHFASYSSSRFHGFS